MSKWKWLVTAVVTVGIGVSAAWLHVQKAKAQDETTWMSLSKHDQSPSGFESFLRAHPSDVAHRVAALVWYERRQPNFAKLRENTLALIRYHPAVMDIKWENTSAFYAHPEYLDEVIGALRDQEAKGHHEHKLYWLLAVTCEQKAMPPLRHSSWGRERFLKYFGLPENTKLRSTVDVTTANDAVHYFNLAISGAGNDEFYPAFYAEQLVGLLMDLGRYDEAAHVSETQLPHVSPINKADFLETYGHCLHKLNRIDKAKSVLASVRQFDTEGEHGGPGHATMGAEMELGLIALESGDLTGADNHLMASCHVEPCCHTMTQGFPLDLPEKLLAVGQRQPVIDFCHTVLSDFAPGQKQTLELLKRAERASTTAKATELSGEN